MELDQNLDELRKQGLGLAAVSYDSEAILKNFAERRKIRFPLLSDADSRAIRAFGILNENAKKDTLFYGIPHPVTFVTDREGLVKTKYFEEDYRERQTLSGLLAKDYAVAPTAARGSVEAKHVKVSTSASTAIIHTGQRVLLAVDVEIPKDYHLYAPGVEDYYSVEWKVDEAPAYKTHEITFPKSKILYLKAIQEKVPVYEGKLRLIRDVTFGKLAGKELTVAGSLRYQACSSTLCYPPETVALRWNFPVEGLDSERAPADIRRK